MSTSEHHPSALFLRALEESDVERTHIWHNDVGLYDTLGDSFRPISRTSELEWLRRKIAFSATELNLAICAKTTGEHIGNIYLRDIDWVARRGSLHIFIGVSEYRGKGYGREAVRQMLRLAFCELNLNRVYLEVLAHNSTAIKTYEACGFEMEGRLKNHCFKSGQFRDVLVMGITADNYGCLEETE